MAALEDSAAAPPQCVESLGDGGHEQRDERAREKDAGQHERERCETVHPSPIFDAGAPDDPQERLPEGLDRARTSEVDADHPEDEPSQEGER